MKISHKYKFIPRAKETGGASKNTNKINSEEIITNMFNGNVKFNKENIKHDQDVSLKTDNQTKKKKNNARRLINHKKTNDSNYKYLNSKEQSICKQKIGSEENSNKDTLKKVKIAEINIKITRLESLDINKVNSTTKQVYYENLSTPTTTYMSHKTNNSQKITVYNESSENKDGRSKRIISKPLSNRDVDIDLNLKNNQKNTIVLTSENSNEASNKEILNKKISQRYNSFIENTNKFKYDSFITIQEGSSPIKTKNIVNEQKESNKYNKTNTKKNNKLVKININDNEIQKSSCILNAQSIIETPIHMRIKNNSNNQQINSIEKAKNKGKILNSKIGNTKAIKTSSNITCTDVSVCNINPVINRQINTIVSLNIEKLNRKFSFTEPVTIISSLKSDKNTQSMLSTHKSSKTISELQSPIAHTALMSKKEESDKIYNSNKEYFRCKSLRGNDKDSRPYMSLSQARAYKNLRKLTSSFEDFDTVSSNTFIDNLNNTLESIQKELKKEFFSKRNLTNFSELTS